MLPLAGPVAFAPGAAGRDYAAGANAGTLGAILKKRQLSLPVSTMSQ